MDKLNYSKQIRNFIVRNKGLINEASLFDIATKLLPDKRIKFNEGVSFILLLANMKRAFKDLAFFIYTPTVIQLQVCKKPAEYTTSIGLGSIRANIDFQKPISLLLDEVKPVVEGYLDYSFNLLPEEYKENIIKNVKVYMTSSYLQDWGLSSSNIKSPAFSFED